MTEIKHTPGPWECDTVQNDGEYGDGGPDTSVGFKSYQVTDSRGRVLFDTLNSDAAEIHDESDEDGHYAWDAIGERNLILAAAAPELLEALREVVRCPSAFIGGGQVRITLDSSTYKRAIDALSKATGSQS